MKNLYSSFIVLCCLLFSSPLCALDYFWVGGSGMWSDHNNHWATSSGGTVFHDQVPQSMDNVFFDANSFPVAGGIVTIDQTIIYCMDMDWTGASGVPRLEGSYNSPLFVYGSFTLIPDMEWEVYSGLHFASFQLGNFLTTAGHIIIADIYFEGFGGEWILQDEIETSGHVYHYNGTLRTNDQTLKIMGYWNFDTNSNNYQTPELYLGTSTLIFIGYAQAWFNFYASISLDADEAKVIFEHGGYIYDNGHTFLDVTFKESSGTAYNINVLGKLKFEASGYYTGGNHYINEAEYLNQGSLFGSDMVVEKVVFWGDGNLGGTNNLIKDVTFKSNGNITDGSNSCLYNYNSINTFGQVFFDMDGTIFGDNIFESLKFSLGETYVIQAGTIQTITALGDFIAEGIGAFPIEIKSCQLGEQATFHKDGAPICLDFLYLTDIVASGTGFSYAGANSDDVYNNEGWIFEGCPACFTDPPLPALALDPVSVTSVLPGEQAKLVLSNVPAGYKVVWFDETQGNELYSNANNNFQPFVTKSIIFYGGIKELTTGCVSEVLAVTVCAPIIEVASEDISCGGSAQIQLFEQSGQGAAWSWSGPAGFGSSDQNPIILNPGVNNVGDYKVVMTDAYGCTNEGTTDVSIYNTFSVNQLPVSCYNSQQYIRFVVNGTGTFNIVNNGSGILSSTTVMGGDWVLLTGLNDFDFWSLTISNPNSLLCAETLAGTLGLCPDAPDKGCNDPVNVSNNTISDESPIVSGDYITWRGYDGQDSEIYLYDTNTGLIENVSNNDYQNYESTIDGDYLAWRSNNGPILYHIPTKIKINLPFYNGSPIMVKGDYVVGTKFDGDFEIVAYQISTSSIFQITNNAIDDLYPKTDGSFLTWTRDNGSSAEVFSYDLLNSGPTIQLTSSGGYNFYPEIENGRIVWYTGNNIIKEYNANNSGPVVTLSGNNELGYTPKTDGTNVVWFNQVQGGLVIFNLTNGNLHKIPGSTNNAGIYQINDGKVVWSDQNPYSGREIFCYDIASNTTSIISNSPYQDYDPATNGSLVCWSSDYEIYLADLSYYPNPPELDLINSDTTSCNPFKLVIKNIQPGYEVVWYDNLFAVDELYAGVVNDFQPRPTQETTYFGGFRNMTTGCISKLIPVTLQGKSAPQVSCPNSRSVSTDSGLCSTFLNNLVPTVLSYECPAALSYTITGATYSSGLGDASGQLFSPGNSFVTYTVADNSQNTGSCIFYIYVYDAELPVLINCPNSNFVVANDSGLCSAQVSWPTPIATDNCGVANIESNYPSGTAFSVGITNVGITATDLSGNQTYCTFSVEVLDQELPVIQCFKNVVLDNDPGMCSKLVLTGLYDATATDNCPGNLILQHNYSPSPENTTLAGTLFPVGTTNVLWNATDVAGNTGSCQQSVVVNDTEAPTFLNCPIQMIMVPNSPNQCSAKVNWSPPAAIDNCGIPVVMQTGGPLSGSVIPVTCPPAPILITFLATDASANTSVCSFEIMVIETERPAFDADIIMPNDTTVNCHQVPSNCIYHGPQNCTPLTNNDVHDNCTAPNDLDIDYNQVSTQNPDPAVCGHYDYDLTRIWTITDCSGNTLIHEQQIEVQDTTKPTAICKNDTITLSDFGTATLLPSDLKRGSWDNCAGNNLTFSASQTLFSCIDLPNSPVTVTLTVTDPCGNFSTCTAQVTIWEGNGKCIPEYDIDGSDPCACLDNATTLDNGQFSELIQIQALAGQVWTLVSSTGLYSIASPAPPATPIPVPTGVLMTNGQVDGLDNDGDGSTDELDERVYYTFKGRHVDAQGYTALMRNHLNQEITLENKCYYPTPYFADFIYNDPLCLGTPPFTIAVAEINNAAGMIVPGSVMVNGVVTTVFDAGTLGIGNHTVMVTFDAFGAQSFTRVNGVVITGSDAAAQADPGCKQKITKIVNVVATPSTLICNDLVHVSMDADCQVTTLVDDVLEGTYFCYDDYTVEVDKTLPYGNGPWLSATFNASDLGKTYQYHVVHSSGGQNICWGEIKVEDKLAPALNCPADITIACSEATDVSHTGNVGIADCSSTTTVVSNVAIDNGECGNPRQIITRKFIVTDAWGNQSTCLQTITVIPFDLLDLVMPADITIDCETAYLNPLATQPVNTGQPSINGAPIGTSLCAATFGFTDVVLNGCAGSTEILRTWTVKNSCLPLSSTNPKTHTQVIRVKDFSGPQFLCPPTVTVSSDPFTCCATAALPAMIVSEGCSQISGLMATVTGTNPTNGNIITFTVGGYLKDFPGNNYWTPDTLAVFDYTQCLPLGTYQVTYSAADACGNLSNCNFQLKVADLVPPSVACDQFTQVALTNNGEAVINASTFDDGTTDNCCLDGFEVRRMNSNSCGGTSFDDTVQFCCSDIGDTILVVFRAYDCYGNSNDCMVSVLVEDKIKPVCSAPAQVNVNCENFDPSLWSYGKADVTDNCCLDTNKVYLGQIGMTHTASYTLFDTVCNKGTITRTFRAFDCAGNSSQCTQRVIMTYEQDYYVKFPNDAIVTVCDGTGNFGEPSFFGEDCELLGVSFADQIYTVVPDACFKIERTWSIINWCTFNPNLPFIEVPNPTPNATANNAANLPGPTVSECGTLPPWKSTVVKINATDAAATDYCSFWNANANGYQYKQIVKIIDGQAPTGTFVTPTCDNSTWTTPNSNQLWNEPEWWDNGIQSHDLCEQPTELCITGTDACSGSNVNIEYLLFLDLENDGTMETVINSVNTGIAGLGWNNVLFNNLNTPNFGGGTSRAFDERLVPANQKYGFAIQETVVGNNKTACVRWNTQQQQSTFVTPELPNGTHKIKWLISDGCGNNTEKEYTFTVMDCKAPTVVCLNGLSVNIMPTGMIQLWASDFLQYTEDNCTPTGQIKIGIRKCGTGTGFPVDANGNPITNVTFTCAELGTQCVELWAIDAAGNADYCETYVIVQDNLGNCPASDKINVVGALKTEMTEGVEEGIVSVDGTSTFAPPYSYFDLSDTLGVYAVTNSVPLAATFVIAPEKDDNPLNGVTTYDLVLISKHILGIEPLTSPYKMIAADANKSGSITTFDMVELRKLILGLYTELPNNTSWRFVDQSFQFPNPNNPFQTAFPETISVADAMLTQAGKDFVGVKIGDLNNTAVANATMPAEDRTSGTAIFDVSPTAGPSPTGEGSSERSVKAGETFDVRFKSAQQLKGFQFTMLLNGLEMVGLTESDQVRANNFGVFASPAGASAKEGAAVTVSIEGAQEFTLRFRAEKAGKLSQMLGVSGAITRAEAYAANDPMTNDPMTNDPMTNDPMTNDPMTNDPITNDPMTNDPMTNDPITNDPMTRLGVAFRFDGKTIAGVGFELYQNQPNPFVNRTFVGFFLPARQGSAGGPEAIEATLSVFDETGRVVYQQKGQFAQGENMIALDRALINTTGVLFYRLETATDSATKKMIQAR